MFEIWRDEFDYVHGRIGEGVYVLTMHPQTTGRGSRMLMLERLIAHIREHDGVASRTMEDVAEESRATHPLTAPNADWPGSSEPA